MDFKEGHRERLKNKFISSPKKLDDYELLELLLFFVIKRKDTKPIAKLCLKQYKTLENIIVNANLLDDIDGIGQNSKLLFQIIKELFNRSQFQKIQKNVFDNYIDGVEAVVSFLRNTIVDNYKELFGILLLNNENRIVKSETLFWGTIDRVHIHKREIIKSILDNNSSRVILYHNHPNFIEAYPSEQDKKLTQEVSDAISVIDCELLDHIIISKGDYYSFKKENIL